MPAIAAARTGSRGALSASARTIQSGGGKLARFWPKTLVSAQVMLSLLLLIVAGLFLRTLRNLQDQDFGFERTHLLLADLDAKLGGYKPHQLHALDQALLERLAQIPGVRSAALSQMPPISGGVWSSNISIAGYTPAPKENMGSNLNRVSGQFFETAGISIVAGRAISPADTLNSLKVVVVSQTIANKYFPKGDAIGHQLKIEMDSVPGPWQIVGIARDSKSGDPRDTDPVRMTYIPLAQIEPYFVDHVSGQREENQQLYANTILLRTAGDPSKTIADLRATVAAVDPNLPLIEVTTIQNQISNLTAHDELISTLTGLFSLLALLLAAIGLYGVMAYNVARRTNEIGIRLALGAQASSVVSMILRESLVLLAVGSGMGLVLALLSTRIVKQQLFGLAPNDPFTFALAFLGVSGMTIMATWLPARRASKVDPVAALRAE